jgi:hypothetical protein
MFPKPASRYPDNQTFLKLTSIKIPEIAEANLADSEDQLC